MEGKAKVEDGEEKTNTEGNIELQRTRESTRKARREEKLEGNRNKMNKKTEKEK